MGCTVCTVESALRALRKCTVCTSTLVHGVHQKAFRFRGGTAWWNIWLINGGIPAPASDFPENPNSDEASEYLFRFSERQPALLSDIFLPEDWLPSDEEGEYVGEYPDHHFAQMKVCAEEAVDLCVVFGLFHGNRRLAVVASEFPLLFLVFVSEDSCLADIEDNLAADLRHNRLVKYAFFL